MPQKPVANPGSPTLTRRAPKGVREELVKEVGFRCPIEGCGVPYLTFHHFGPPWKVKAHHNPAGMVALCSNHAAKADNGYYPDDHFRRLKAEGAGRAATVSGEFDYLRRNVLAMLGSNMFYNVDTIVEVGGERQVFFERDANGYLLLNFKLPGADGAPRAWMENNVWVVEPGADYIECPPRGRYLSVDFPNGDHFRVEYSDVESKEEFLKKYPIAKYPPTEHMADVVDYPLTIAEFWEKAQGTTIQFGKNGTQFAGNLISNSAMTNARVGISMESEPTTQLPFEMHELLARALELHYSAQRIQ